MFQESIQLVDCNDRPISTEDKLVAHEQGLLHRAVSVFAVGPQGQILLQRRALRKYHSAGLWSNSCCGHPLPGEQAAVAARRRLKDELGISAARITYVSKFHYCCRVSPSMIENEIVHLYRADLPSLYVAANPGEVACIRWTTKGELFEAVRHSPNEYSEWLRVYLTSFSRTIIKQLFLA